MVNTFSDRINQLTFRWDSVIPQVYLATDNGEGISYGASLEKSLRFVPAQITVVDEQGTIIACDTGWQGQV